MSFQSFQFPEVASVSSSKADSDSSEETEDSSDYDSSSDEHEDEEEDVEAEDEEEDEEEEELRVSSSDDDEEEVEVKPPATPTAPVLHDDELELALLGVTEQGIEEVEQRGTPEEDLVHTAFLAGDEMVDCITTRLEDTIAHILPPEPAQDLRPPSPKGVPGY